MSLNGKQFKELAEALRSAYNTYGQLSQLIQYNTSYRLEDISAPGTMPEVIHRLINEAEAKGWTYDLVKVAVEDNPNNPELGKFIKDFSEFDPKNTPAEPPDYYKSYFLYSNNLFVGRTELRDILRELRESENSYRIFRVVGPRVSGKTYTHKLINHLALKEDGQPAIYIDFDQLDYSPFQVIQDIAKAMRLDKGEIDTIPVQGSEQIPRHIHDLCGWLRNQIRAIEGKTWWFVFDGFREKPLLPETRDLIAGLAKTVVDELPDKCYLVLLNYPQNILPVEIEISAVEEKAEKYDREDLIDFFEQWFTENGKTYSRDVFEKVVDHIYKKTDTMINETAGGDQQKLDILKQEELKYLSLATIETVRTYKQQKFVI